MSGSSDAPFGGTLQSGTKKSGISCAVGSIRYWSKSVTPFVGEERIVDQEIAGEIARLLVKDQIGRIGHDLHRAAMAHAFVARKRVLDRRRGDTRARPQRVERDAVIGEFRRHAQHAHAHAELRHRVGRVTAEPARRHVERRRQHQHMRIGRLLQIAECRSAK